MVGQISTNQCDQKQPFKENIDLPRRPSIIPVMDQLQEKRCCSSKNDSNCQCSKPVSSGNAAGCCGTVPRDKILIPPTPPPESTLLPEYISLQNHIRVLYAVVICLTLMLVSSMVIFYLEINSLREELAGKVTLKEMVQIRFPETSFSNEDLLMPYLVGSSWWTGRDGTVWVEEDENAETGIGRKKRDANMEEDGSGDAPDWTWMSSYARIPVAALKKYCKDSRLYCAAHGPPGVPGGTGPPGVKGEPGTKGSKGASPDAATLANYEALRGAAGPKGDRGERGYTGPVGPQGPKGEEGVQGEKGVRGQAGMTGKTGKPGPAGMKGERGLRGVKGEMGLKGMDGHPAMPGEHGSRGDRGRTGPMGPRGPRGNKGENGFCEVQCMESRRTTQANFPPRKSDCSISAIGKPVYETAFATRDGSWMTDVGKSSPNYWVTHGTQGNQVEEFANMNALKSKRSTRRISLEGKPYFGTGHVVFNRCLYYHWADQPKIVKLDLKTMDTNITVKDIRDLGPVYYNVKDMKANGYLYHTESTFIDFNIDKNGLWIVYVHRQTGKIAITLLEPETLQVISTRYTKLDGGTKGNSFVLCGKLYTLKHSSKTQSFLDTITDIWTGDTEQIHLAFNNPYGHTCMLTAFLDRLSIMTWDAGKVLSAPFLVK